MRVLAIGAAAFSAAVFAANYILPTGSLIPAAAAFAAAAVLLLAARRRWLRGFIIAAFAVAAGCAVFRLHADRTTVPAAELSGETLEIDAVLLDYPAEYDGYCRAEVRLSGDMPHLKTLLYDDEKQLAGAQPGEHIHLTARLKAADTRYGKDYDYYNSKGIYLTAYAKSNITVSEGRSAFLTFPVRIRHYIARTVNSIFPQDVSGFFRSVMLGDKTGLYDDIPRYLALTRAGFMHIAAVSGMHVAFLVSFIQLLFGKTRRSSLFCIGLLWVFVLVTGSGPSAVRAGFMQSLLLIAPVVRRENDPATALSTVLALVLLANPHAAASVSLQLSFGAMAGILCFNGRINALIMQTVRSARARCILRYPAGIAATSLAVMVVTVPLTAIHFGYVAILSPLMNVAALWAVSLCFCGGLAACALALIYTPLGVLAAWLVSWAARYIFAVAGLISSVPFALLYLDNGAAVWWIVLVYVLAAAAAFTRAGAAYKLLCPAALSAAALFVMLLTVKHGYLQGSGTITVLDVGQGQSIAVMSGGSCIVIDCGGGGKQRRAGETAGAYLLGRGRTRIDALVLTHLHADHANGVLQLMEMVDVERIIMPSDPNDDDGLYEPILESARRHGAELEYISSDTSAGIGGIGLELYAPADSGDTNERCMMCRVSLGSYDMLVTGDAPAEAEGKLAAEHDLSGTELLIAGHHGSKYSSSPALLEETGADTAVISVGYNTYGHPTNQTLERLEAYGCDIYRTDLNGNVEIRIWKP